MPHALVWSSLSLAWLGYDKRGKVKLGKRLCGILYPKGQIYWPFIQNNTFLAKYKSLQVQLRDCVAPWWTQIGVRLWDVESCTMSVSGSQCRDVKLAQRRNVVMSRCHDVMLAHNVTLLSLLFTLCIASDGRWACLWNSLFGRHHQILSDFAPTRHIDLVLTTTCSDSKDTSHWLLYQLNLLVASCYINLSFLYHFDIILNPHAQILHVIVLVTIT